MKAWKRNLLIIYLLCSALMVVFFYLLLFGSTWSPFAKFLLFVVGLVAIAGILAGIYVVIYAFAHEHATLHAGPGGIINIERSALESTARRALAGVKGITVQNVRANVIERKGVPVIDVTVTAIPFGDDSLMTTASQIQTAVKRSVEGFTDHEVRYVAVNFIEPRKRDEIKAAAASVDKRAAEGHAAPRFVPGSSARTAADAEAVRQKPAHEHGTNAATSKASLWERARARVAATRDTKDEDIVETEAVVETVSVPSPEPTPQPAPAVDLHEDEDVFASVEEPVEGAAVKQDDAASTEEENPK